MTTSLQPNTSSSEDHDTNHVVDMSPLIQAVTLAGHFEIAVVPLDADGEQGEEKPSTDPTMVLSWFGGETTGAVVGAVHDDNVVLIPPGLAVPGDNPDKWLEDLADAAAPTFNYISMADLNRKDITNPGWIVQGIWPGDAYGTLAAEAKAGKTWSQLDLAVSVATGGRWMDAYQCDKGTVVVFLGEGGERNTRRRLRAVCEDKGVDPDTLDNLLIVNRVPHFNDAQSMGLFRRTLRRIDPRLVIVDPLYFAAAGGEGSNIYSMGDLLEQAQHAADAVDAALVVVHHFNQTGSGNSARRMTGAGPEEWSRVLGAAGHKELSSSRPDESRVQIDWEFTGGEIAPQRLSVIRTVWVDDPDDLTSPMHYSIEVVGNEEGNKLPDSVQATLDVLTNEWATASDIHYLLTESGTSIHRDTVTTNLRKLVQDSFADKTGPDNKPTYRKTQ